MSLVSFLHDFYCCVVYTEIFVGNLLDWQNLDHEALKQKLIRVFCKTHIKRKFSHKGYTLCLLTVEGVVPKGNICIHDGNKLLQKTLTNDIFQSVFSFHCFCRNIPYPYCKPSSSSNLDSTMFQNNERFNSDFCTQQPVTADLKRAFLLPLSTLPWNIKEINEIHKMKKTQRPLPPATYISYSSNCM